MTLGATLGGEMVYRMGVMINRNAYRNGPVDFRAAIVASKLAEGQMVRVELEGQPILLVKSGSKICAIGAVCSHYGAPLNEGTIEDGAVRCVPGTARVLRWRMAASAKVPPAPRGQAMKSGW